MADAAEVNGIILSVMPVGEADRRVLLLTRELGKISVFARGARKPTSMLVGVTRTFAFGRFFLYPGRDAYTLQKAEISEYFEDVVKNIEKTAYGCYFLELASAFSRENVPAEDLLLLVYYALKALSKEQIPKKLVMRCFETKLLTVNGMFPDFHHCASCREEKPEGYFDEGLLLYFCPDCGKGKYAFPLSKSTLYALRFIEDSKIPKLFTFTVSQEVLSELSGVSEDLMRRSLDREIESGKLLSVMTEE